MRLPALVWFVAHLLFGPAPALAQWSEVGPGLAYREYALPGPVRVFAVRADRSVHSWTIDTMKGQGQMKGGRETVPDMAARYQDSITFDGSRYDVKVAINGDYFNPTTGVPLQGQVISGWFAKRFEEDGGASGFVWTSDRRCFLGGNVHNGTGLQQVVFADGARMKINQLNEPRATNSLALYTAQYSTNTGTAADGVEVLVRLESPLQLLAALPGVPGEVRSVCDRAGSSLLPFKHVVLSAQGRPAAELLRHARAGQMLHFALTLEDLGKPDIGLPPGDWRHAYASLGEPKCVLVNGKVPRDWEVKAARYAKQGKTHGSVVKDPRTAIAFNAQYLYFLVIDGRSKASIGMTFTEAGSFCRDELQATDAVLQDGGGSSTLWVNGQVKNTPSGKGKEEKAGVLRPVANGYLIAEVMPPGKSDQFRAGQSVRLSGQLRLCPDPASGSAGQGAAGDTATILPEPLNGVFSKGKYWWLCRWGNAEGWAASDQLAVLR